MGSLDEFQNFNECRCKKNVVDFGIIYWIQTLNCTYFFNSLLFYISWHNANAWSCDAGCCGTLNRAIAFLTRVNRAVNNCGGDRSTDYKNITLHAALFGINANGLYPAILMINSNAWLWTSLNLSPKSILLIKRNDTPLYSVVVYLENCWFP